MSKKIGFACGCFDLIHPGHVLMLQDCKRVCDYLIVAVQSDPTINRNNKNNSRRRNDRRN
jgi:glycerol-3-phosphate cytidylyltransferase